MKSDARLLARTLALRQARAVISKHLRFLDNMIGNSELDSRKTIEDYANNARKALKQIDEALE